MMLRRLLVAVLTLYVVGPAGAVPPAGAPECPLFPTDDVWHADISALPVHPRSATWLTAMGGPDRRLHPDFGPSDTAQPYGIPYAIVRGTHQKVAVSFDYADESDPGPYPFGPDIPVEGGSDRHALMLDRDACRLYELYDAHYDPNGSTAGSGAVWDLRSHQLRPAGWTSADAAGLPILPGLLRRDEVAAGSVDHAIRVTAQRTDRSYLWPARHQAGAAADPSLPPMGARFRLRADYPMARFRPDTQVVLRAMQHYGMVLADNGSNWYFTGTSENGWDTAMLDELKTVPAGAFDAIDVSSLMIDPNSGQVRGGGGGGGSSGSSGGTATTHPRATTPPTAAPVASSTTSTPPPSSEPTTSSTTRDADLATGRRRRRSGDGGGAPGLLVLGAGAALVAAGLGAAALARRRSVP
jgi:hypothetical protein